MGSIHSRELLNLTFEFKLQTANESSAIVMVEVFYIHKDTSIKTHKLIFHYEKLATKKIKMKNAYKCTPLNITENVLFHLKPLFISRSYFKFDFKLRLSEPICVIYLCLYLYLFFISSLFSPFFQNRM